VPGSVENAEPVTVLPHSLCNAFVRDAEYPVPENQYRNGESQRSKLAETSRKAWRTSRRLTAAELSEFQDFYDARKGIEPFYFYDPYESGFLHDPTGEFLTGRHIVRFEGPWGHAIGLGRAEASVMFVELA
jgi:hypothetical protein